jgi:hypothetical protein
MGEDVNVIQSQAPTVRLTRIDRIDTFEVMATELDTLDQIVSDENRALGFFSLLIGIFASSLTSLVALPPPHDAARAWAVYVAILFLTGFLSLSSVPHTRIQVMFLSSSYAGQNPGSGLSSIRAAWPLPQMFRSGSAGV